MLSPRRQRGLYFGIALLVIPVGLLARGFRSGADASTPIGFIATYLGDTLWAVLFFFVFAGCFVRWRTLQLASLTLAVTLGIELSQLYQGQPLHALRSVTAIRFLIGSDFLWSDVACLCAGTAAACAMHRLLPRTRT